MNISLNTKSTYFAIFAFLNYMETVIDIRIYDEYLHKDLVVVSWMDVHLTISYLTNNYQTN